MLTYINKFREEFQPIIDKEEEYCYKDTVYVNIYHLSKGDMISHLAHWLEVIDDTERVSDRDEIKRDLMRDIIMFHIAIVSLITVQNCDTITSRTYYDKPGFGAGEDSAAERLGKYATETMKLL